MSGGDGGVEGVGSQGAHTKYVDSGLYWAGYTTLVDSEAGINVLFSHCLWLCLGFTSQGD